MHTDNLLYLFIVVDEVCGNANFCFNTNKLCLSSFVFSNYKYGIKLYCSLSHKKTLYPVLILHVA